MFCKAKSVTKTKIFARRFYTIFKQKCSNLRPLFSITFPQGFWISKNIGHTTSGSGGKKTFKQYLKSEHTDGQTDGQTDRQTDRQTDISTYRKHRPRGPMLWKHWLAFIVDRHSTFLPYLWKNKPAAQSAGADPSHWSSTSRQNPPIQQNPRNFWTNTAI